MIIIRRFKPSDFPSIVDIERKVFKEHDPYLYMQFYETCADGFIVAEINGTVIGYVVGYQISEHIGRVFSIAVYPKYQNRGIGSCLLKEIIRVLSKYGVSQIILEVRQSNLKAKRFYERHGFIQTGIAKHYYSNGENAYLMKLKI